VPPIVNDRIVWSVGLSVCLSPSEPCRQFGSDRDTVCVQDLGGPRETPVAQCYENIAEVSLLITFLHSTEMYSFPT